MGLLDKLKDLGLVETTEQPAAVSTSVPRVNIPTPPVPAVLGAGVAVDPDLKKTLEHAILKSPLQGYTNFQTLFTALEGVDASLRYKLALQTLQATFKLSAQDVISALNDRLSLLDGEKRSFEAAVKAETDSKIEGSIQQINTLAATIKARQEEIASLERKQAELTAQVASTQATLATERAQFDATYTEVRSSILAEIEKIKPYITS